MLVKNHRKSFLSLLLITLMTMGSMFVNTSLANTEKELPEHEYARITRQRVEAAIKPGATKAEIKLAEGSLTALGWFVIYGNDTDSFNLVQVLNKKVADHYNGTDKMDVIYMKHTSEAYGEMLNLRRFEKQKPENPSDEYSRITQQRVEAALAPGAGYKEFKLAEGSLCALGWLTLYGNDSNSDRLARTMMNLAYNHWKGANEVYMLQSSEAYAEMINLGRFKLSSSLANNNNALREHEYAGITRERVAEATKPNATKEQIRLAEGSLTALGWFVIYGNDTDSFNLVQVLNKKVADHYNGTDKMDVIYMKHTSEAYGEMLNLRRFEKQKPENPSNEYYQLTKQRVEAALAPEAVDNEFKLAEGSLCALGWLTLYGNDSNSDRLARTMMNLAYNHWKGANEVYMLQSSTAYSEMINLGRFKLNQK